MIHDSHNIELKNTQIILKIREIRLVGIKAKDVRV